MEPRSRRDFLYSLAGSAGWLSASGFLPLQPVLRAFRSPQEYSKPAPPAAQCWLDLCAPFIADDPGMGLQSQIFLTSDTFVGRRGYEDGADATEYEIYLYDPTGVPQGSGGIAKRLVVPAMSTTTLSVRELIGGREPFWGGMRIRLRPKGRAPMHASDLFSSAFVRWKTARSFDNVHANPDPLEWQRPDSFFYSMPFPPLAEYESIFSLFNPNAERSAGTLTVFDQRGAKLKELPYDLKARATLLFDLRSGEFINDPRQVFGFPVQAPSRAHHYEAPLLTAQGGTIAVANQAGTQKAFAYLMVKRAGGERFSVEHPIHQAPFKSVPTPPPFDAGERFKARNVLFTPLVFRSKQFDGITLDSRFHFSSGAPLAEFLWLYPLISDSRGNVVWQSAAETRLPAAISPSQIERGAIKLGAMQSCIFDVSEISLPKSFSGGLSLAVAPTTNHTLMKVEISAKEWGAHAFTHFRPGLQSARGYQSPAQRGGLATDYIVCGARVETSGNKKIRDEIIAVINIDDKSIAGNPSLEVFASDGLLTRIDLGEVPSFGCRHYLLSDISSGKIGSHDLTLRLVDERATLLMSVVHLDYVRRDLALDHGSDRFSTFNDYTCRAQS